MATVTGQPAADTTAGPRPHQLANVYAGRLEAGLGFQRLALALVRQHRKPVARMIPIPTRPWPAGAPLSSASVYATGTQPWRCNGSTPLAGPHWPALDRTGPPGPSAGGPSQPPRGVKRARTLCVTLRDLGNKKQPGNALRDLGNKKRLRSV